MWQWCLQSWGSQASPGSSYFPEIIYDLDCKRPVEKWGGGEDSNAQSVDPISDIWELEIKSLGLHRELSYCLVSPILVPTSRGSPLHHSFRFFQSLISRLQACDMSVGVWDSVGRMKCAMRKSTSVLSTCWVLQLASCTAQGLAGCFLPSSFGLVLPFCLSVTVSAGARATREMEQGRVWKHLPAYLLPDYRLFPKSSIP